MTNFEPDYTMVIFDAETGKTLIRELTKDEILDFEPVFILKDDN